MEAVQCSVVYARCGLLCKERKDITKFSRSNICECAAAECVLNGFKSIIICIYRPRNSDIEMFLICLEQILESCSNETCAMFVAGDFNINITEKNKLAFQFLSLLSTYNLYPSTVEYTRITHATQSCLDNIFTNVDDYNCKLIDYHISDHVALVLSFHVQYQEIKVNVTKRIFNSASVSSFREMLKQQNWQNIYICPENDVNAQWSAFIKQFKLIFEECFPMKTFQLKKSIKCPYFNNSELSECKKQLDVLLVLSNYSEIFKDLYKQKRKDFDQQLADSKAKYYSSLIENADDKNKSVWQVINTIKGKTKSEINLNVDDPLLFAEDMNKFLINVTQQLTQGITFPSATYKNIKNNCSSFFSPVDTFEVIGFAKKLKNKLSAGIDEVPTRLVKESINEICEPLTYIINNSFLYGIYPSQLKYAIVKPIYKKGDPMSKENYRPISILTAFNKIFECAFCSRLISFFYNCNLLNNSQHGYLKGRSVETAVCDYVEQIVKGIDSKLVSLGIFLDLSKAYDSIDHDILLQKLNLYGIRGVNLSLIKSYLSDRYQKVELNYHGDTFSSAFMKITTGIPQGSIAGPLLFVIYVNDIVDIVTENQKIVNYADDTSLLVSGKSLNSVIENSETLLKNINEWMLGNHLFINKEKTNFVLFRSARSNLNIPETIAINDNNVTLAKNTKFLGVLIDENITWSSQIELVVGKLNKACYTIRFLSNYVNEQVLKTIYYSNFYSVMRFNILNWGSSTELTKVFLLQKRTVRILKKMKFNQSCRGVFRSNNLLTAPAIYIYESIMHLFKNKNDYEIFKPSHQYPTRSMQLNYPIHNLSHYESGPLYSSIKFFNNLPDSYKLIVNVKLFKKSLFSYLKDLEPYTIGDYLVLRNI